MEWFTHSRFSVRSHELHFVGSRLCPQICCGGGCGTAAKEEAGALDPLFVLSSWFRRRAEVSELMLLSRTCTVLMAELASLVHHQLHCSVGAPGTWSKCTGEETALRI